MRYATQLKRFAACAGLVLATGWISAQQVSFMKNYGGHATDSGRCLEFTSDGGYIIAGHTTTYSNGFADLYVIRTSSMGDTVWTKKYGGSGVEHGYTVSKTSDGNYILAGSTTSNQGNGEDAFLYKIDEAGNLLWQKTFGGPGNDRVESAYEAPDGGIIMVGNSNSAPSTSVDVFLVKTDASGTLQWTQRFGGPAFDNGNMVQPTTDGGYIIVGQTYSFGSGSGDYWLIKTDASGTIVWDKTFGGPGLDEGKNVRQTSDGGFIITGDTDSFGAGSDDIYYIKTDANGEIVWSKVLGTPMKEASKMIEECPDGGYVIAGITRGFSFVNPNAWLIKTNSTGDTTWTRFYGKWSHEHLYCAKPHPDGGYIAAGHSDSYGDEWKEQVILIKTDNMGYIPSSLFEGPYESFTFSVYPNPNEGLFSIDLDMNGAPFADIQLMNTSGQIVLQERVESNGAFHKKIDLTGFAKGIYLMGISMDGQQTTKKVTVY
jgi:hypothetical protein